jgi:hypothetical protein
VGVADAVVVRDAEATAQQELHEAARMCGRSAALPPTGLGDGRAGEEQHCRQGDDSSHRYSFARLSADKLVTAVAV